MQQSHFTPCRTILRSESKQKFFATKRAGKRLKVSTCFSDCADSLEKQQESFMSVQTKESYHKPDKEELASTFGSEAILAFKVKQPKRKHRRHHKNQNCLLEEVESDTEGQNIKAHEDIIKMPIQMLVPAKKHRFTIDSFLIIRKLGEGTYSQVYQAVERQTGFMCALKVMEKQKVKKLGVQQNLIRQIKIQSFLEHPYISKMYGCFQDQTSIYLISELGTDKNLYDSVLANPRPNQKKQKGLPVDEVAKLVGQLASALSCMHDYEVIHRDIKPQNVLLTFGNTIKLCDFGWSVHCPQKQMRSTMCGTPLYLAPQLIKQAEYNDSVDVWALGILTYQLITEEIPFKIRSIRDLSKVIHQDIRYDKIQCKEAVDFIRLALEKDAEKRPAIQELTNHKFLSIIRPQQLQLL